MIRPNRTNPEFELGGVHHVGFFWFTDTPAARTGLGDTVTAVGSMNHPAFHVPPERSTNTRSV